MSHNSTILITGATSGIGYGLAQTYAKAGHDLVLTARTHFQLEHMAEQFANDYNIQVFIIPDDLSDPDAPQRIYAMTKMHNIHVDILINNAGFGLQGKFSQTNLTTELNMIQVNISALTELTKLFLEDMIREGQGHIVNIASTAAFQPGPYMAVYYATKSYVLHFSEALREELKKTGVSVTTICPGPTKTNFENTANMEFSKNFNIMHVDEAVNLTFHAIQQKKHIAILGNKNKWLAFSTRFAPYYLLTKIVARLQK